jgi:hypothetical protein
VKSSVKLLALLIFVSLTGCAATVNRSTTNEIKLTAPSAPIKKIALLVTGNATCEASSDWQAFQAEWRTAMEAAVSSTGLPFEYLDSKVPEQAKETILVQVKVNDYRYLTSGARYGFGVLVGNAYMDSDVKFIELPAQKTLGTRKYSTTSSAWQGAFSAMTDKQLQAVSNEIVKEIIDDK